MNIKVDNREDKRRITSCVRYYTDSSYNPKAHKYTGKGNVLEISQLPIGDYVFENKVAFEFKTPSDIINSIIDGRVFRQAHHMKQYPFSYIVVVGNVADEINRRNEPLYYNKYNKIRKFTLKNYLGALARLYTYTTVIHVDNNQQCWILLEYMASKLLEENKDVKGIDKPQFKLTDPIATFIGCIYVNKTQRVSSKQAVMIREHLHLETLQDLLNIEYDDLIGIKGIGSKTARAVMEAIK